MCDESPRASRPETQAGSQRTPVKIEKNAISINRHP